MLNPPESCAVTEVILILIFVRDRSPCATGSA
jgi:hypothetical protein